MGRLFTYTDSKKGQVKEYELPYNQHERTGLLDTMQTAYGIN
jgi:hypothetical protein